MGIMFIKAANKKFKNKVYKKENNYFINISNLTCVSFSRNSIIERFRKIKDFFIFKEEDRAFQFVYKTEKWDSGITKALKDRGFSYGSKVDTIKEPQNINWLIERFKNSLSILHKSFENSLNYFENNPLQPKIVFLEVNFFTSIQYFCSKHKYFLGSLCLSFVAMCAINYFVSFMVLAIAYFRPRLLELAFEKSENRVRDLLGIKQSFNYFYYNFDKKNNSEEVLKEIRSSFDYLLDPCVLGMQYFYNNLKQNSSNLGNMVNSFSGKKECGMNLYLYYESLTLFFMKFKKFHIDFLNICDDSMKDESKEVFKFLKDMDSVLLVLYPHITSIVRNDWGVKDFKIAEIEDLIKKVDSEYNDSLKEQILQKTKLEKEEEVRLQKELKKSQAKKLIENKNIQIVEEKTTKIVNKDNFSNIMVVDSFNNYQVSSNENDNKEISKIKNRTVIQLNVERDLQNQRKRDEFYQNYIKEKKEKEEKLTKEHNKKVLSGEVAVYDLPSSSIVESIINDLSNGNQEAYGYIFDCFKGGKDSNHNKISHKDVLSLVNAICGDKRLKKPMAEAFAEDIQGWIHVRHSSDTGDLMPSNYLEFIRKIFIEYGFNPESTWAKKNSKTFSAWSPKSKMDSEGLSNQQQRRLDFELWNVKNGKDKKE